MNMNKDKLQDKLPAAKNALPPVDPYDDGNIPDTDLPQNVIPDEVPRKDGPGGEDGE